MEGQIPSIWNSAKGSVLKQLNLNSMSWGKKEDAIKQYNPSQKEIDDGFINSRTGDIKNEDEFLWVETDEKKVAIRWSSVESYNVERIGGIG